jgi:hypothetical protein
MPWQSAGKALAVGGNGCVVLVVLGVHAEAAARERVPDEALVRPAVAVLVRLDPCVARCQAENKRAVSAKK